MGVAGGGGGGEVDDVVPDEDGEDRGVSSFWTNSLRVGGAAVTTAAGTVAAFLGFRPLLPPPPAAAFRFAFPAPVALTGAGTAGAIAAGLGAMGLNLSMMFPICHAWFLGAKQHPPFLSIVGPNSPTSSGTATTSLCCFLGSIGWVPWSVGL
jgi:hypothetical protein